MNSPFRWMGILNATPNSFYDKGQWNTLEKALARGLVLASQGAHWIDIGGESTRPGATPVPEEEEKRRVIPLVKALKEAVATPLSIDTMKAGVAAAAIEAGASLINDVSGFRDPDMRALAASSGLPICVMHMHETPATMQHNPHYPQGVVASLVEWFQRRVDLLLDTGVKESAIILDPGIGFGKTKEDNFLILNHLREIKALGFPVLIGLSRKSFLGLNPETLGEATRAANALAVANGADILRVHDVTLLPNTIRKK